MPTQIVNGVRLYYQEWGSGEPILLLHSALGTHTQSWGSIPAKLTRFGRVVALDMRGHGRSETPSDDLRLDDLVADIRAFADALGLDRLCLSGYSMGGMVAMAFALKHPERLAALHLHGVKLRWEPGRLEDFVGGMEPERLAERYPAWTESLAREHGSVYGPEYWKTLAGRTAQLIRAVGTVPLLSQDQLSELAMPVLLSVGDRDELVSLEEAVDSYRALPHGEFAVIPATYHVLRTVNPALVAELMRDFFSRATGVGPRAKPMTF